MAVKILNRTKEGPNRATDWQLQDDPSPRLPVGSKEIDDDEDRRRA